MPNNLFHALTLCCDRCDSGLQWGAASSYVENETYKFKMYYSSFPLLLPLVAVAALLLLLENRNVRSQLCTIIKLVAECSFPLV